MKLDTDQIERVTAQTGAEPIPDDHPAMDQLVDVFGQHTFYVDRTGLFVWEDVQEVPDEGSRPAAAVRIAGWSEDAQDTLKPHEPMATNVLVDLEAAGPAPHSLEDPEDDRHGD